MADSVLGEEGNGLSGKYIHFKALRVVVCDYRQRMNHEFISAKTNRLPPQIWYKFAGASSLMRM